LTALPEPSANHSSHEPHRLAQVLSRADYEVTRRLAAILERDGSTIEEWRALSLLADGESRAMSELAEVCLLPAATLTRLVDRMVAENLVYRRGDPGDRRRILVRITERGGAQHGRLLARLRRDNVLAGIGDDLVQLTDVLNAMIDRLRGMDSVAE
jgi:DNA-binding MarR family transcriptional regulator